MLHLFCYRVVNSWNALPAEIKDAKTLGELKKFLGMDLNLIL